MNHTTYTGPTASMQVDPEAPHIPEAASESYVRAFPIASARCQTWPATVEWVPSRERAVVPNAMAALCRRCEGRQQCLLWALAGNEAGYWAGTTTNDRTHMRTLGQSSVETADWIQQLVRDHVRESEALHELGGGSYWWYRRRGCRCTQCKQANADQRAQERGKARQRAGNTA